MALTDSGRLFVWGRVSCGRLGISSERDALTPVEVFLPGGFWPKLPAIAYPSHHMTFMHR